MFDGLRQLFGTGNLPTVVSDSPYARKQFAAQGFTVLTPNSISSRETNAPHEVLFVPSVPSVHPNPELLAVLKDSAVLVVPLLAFSSSDRDVDYLVKRLKLLCFETACKKNLQLIEFIQHVKKPITVKSTGCSLTVELGENVDVMVPKISPEISVGEWISIIQYLEVGLVPNSENSSFLVNGTLSCDGIVVAHHLHTHFKSGPIASEAWQLFKDLRLNGQFPLIIEIENSTVQSILTNDGSGLADNILVLTDEIMRGNLTEVAFAALPMSDETDWSLNSQLNEPAGGVHVGIGSGENAAHIDFISPQATFSG